MKGKRLVRIETGVWIDPDHVVAIYPLAIGTRGFARVVFDTGETLDCQEHEAIVSGKADPEVVENLMMEIVDGMVYDPALSQLGGSYGP